MSQVSKTPFILGLTGGILGFFISIALVDIGDIIHGIVSGVGSASEVSAANTISFLAGMGVLWSIIGIIGASLSLEANRSVTVTSGIIMLMSAFGGLLGYSIGTAFFPSFILLLMGGIMALRKSHIQPVQAPPQPI